MFTPHPSMSRRRDPRRAPSMSGTLLQLGSIWKRSRCVSLHPGAPGVLVRFQTVPADVCRNRNCHRQRTTKSSPFLGTPACETLPPSVSGQTSAHSGSPCTQQTADERYDAECGPERTYQRTLPPCPQIALYRASEPGKKTVVTSSGTFRPTSTFRKSGPQPSARASGHWQYIDQNWLQTLGKGFGYVAS